jgi:putative nucleotidyltransferase with HDIG domain
MSATRTKKARKQEVGSFNDKAKPAPLSSAQKSKVAPGSSYETLESRFPQVKALSGMDQKSPFHSLTADDHTKEVASNLLEEDAVSSLGDRIKAVVVMAAYFHDIGKTDPNIQKTDEETGKMSYSGHEKSSAAMMEEILPDLDVDENEAQMIVAIVKNHGLALRLKDTFAQNDQPKGKALKAYGKFVKAAKEMPGSDSKEGVLKNASIMLAFCRADTSASVNAVTRDENPEMVKRIENDISQLNTLEMAMPAIVEAVERKDKGDQKAGVVKQGDKYVCPKPKEKKGPSYDMKALSAAIRENGIPEKAMGALSKSPNEKALFANLKKAGLEEHYESIKNLAEQHRKN